jgi:GNAT superfamily N-acetyltransferase
VTSEAPDGRRPAGATHASRPRDGVDVAGASGLATSVSDLHIRPVDDEATMEDWREVHNVVIPADPLSRDDVRERVGRNRLDVAYLDGVLVGCSTVRPPETPGAAATVIARVLPEHRRRGFGSQLYAAALRHARTLGADGVETIVWAANADGLLFAEARGFVEVDSYLPPGADVAYLTLRLHPSPT